jgi:hypothetical protein
MHVEVRGDGAATAAGNEFALILHSRDDDEVPFSDAVQIASANRSPEFAVFDGLGHRGILYAPPAVRAAGNFLTRLIGMEPAHAFTAL